VNYAEFLARKALTVAPGGFTPDSFTVPLFPFQRDLVSLACKLGRFCIWADCGMGKTPMQLEWAHQVCQQTGGRVLILAPLAVSHQTVREAEKFHIDGVSFAAHPGDTDDRIVVTNYQKLDRFNPEDFVGVVIDESSILKAMDGKTRSAILDAFRRTPYRLACSATPAPNDYMELGNHAEFVGVMTREEMLAMFFVHDGGDTSKWRIKGHAVSKFWEWVCSWAVTIRKPSDIGYDDGAFNLPALEMRDCVVETPHDRFPDDGGQVSLFPQQARTLSDQRAVQRGSLALRVAEAVKLANQPGQWIVWCHLNDESTALAASIDGAVEVTGSDSDDHKTRSAMGFQDGTIRVIVSKGSIFGFGMNFQNCHQVVFVGMSHSYEQYYQSIRRCWRFGQNETVRAYLVYDWAEGAVIENIRRKDADATMMADAMVEIMRANTLEQLQQVQRNVAPYAETVHHGRGMARLPGRLRRRCQAASLTTACITRCFRRRSPASTRTATATETWATAPTGDEFFGQFKFWSTNCYRVTMPGRLLSFHCMNLPSSKARDGIIGLKDFRGDLIRAFTDAGWVYHSEVVIWKDPVTAMQRTKALGLLHKQIKKDSCMSPAGHP
jgi:superfamily II DNA or RNA helicase